MTPSARQLALALLLASGCGGEVTSLEYDERQEASFERFRDEVQPALTTDDPSGALSRNCAVEGCHAASVGGLRLIDSGADEDVNANFQQVAAKLVSCDMGDPAWPDSCVLLSDPLTGSPDHPVRSFSGTDDCCYRIVRAWMTDEANPGCACP